ncbi:hypothetical protein DDB_G0295769 [Dictyostelium discoideum AX4]|uniref:Uncharacterized protein n=1 Tax=Dictyostelium discoideum TaxID=44689 RepID=C7G021_DICDI|nr:hypothetical protein DDB_G0295769 [Dictyostelium discoideum AX4]EEU04095.1 hypothetical protein DDB_G0295769 [Dictyostelium discoideum AX4]|eukprot:XP_002649147.1 hypothetical protein DDB_G0295769 [Dictyostelium discoideum AX4]
MNLFSSLSGKSSGRSGSKGSANRGGVGYGWGS